MIRRLLRTLAAGAAAAGACLPGLPAVAQPAALEPVIGPDGAPFVERGWSAWQRPGTRHRFEDGRLALIAGLLIRTPAGAPPPAPLLSTPREVVPGAPLRVYLAAAQPLSGVRVSVRTAAGNLVSARAFAAHRGTAGDRYDRLWVAVLGIPSTAEPGIGQLLVTGAGGPESVAAEVPVLQAAEPLFIGTRRFAEEEIPLRKGLGELRRRDDPERVEQARELWRLLGTWRPVDDGHAGRLQYPVVGARRSAGFGDRRLYRYDDNSTDRSIHNGVDFAAPEGTVVVAAGAGTVVMARFRIITGLTVVIEHLPAVYSLYYHLSRLNVALGERVEPGTALGAVGSTGLATGPHLHWEVRAAGVAVDPDVLVTTPLVDIPDDLGTLFP
ncbi:MAG: M23 family metallopeptidase [Spirochaetaceae bacterium]|nr:M23 family metallopeptidase [Spirochaetaceae bacterium]